MKGRVFKGEQIHEDDCFKKVFDRQIECCRDMVSCQHDSDLTLKLFNYCRDMVLSCQYDSDLTLKDEL